MRSLVAFVCQEIKWVLTYLLAIKLNGQTYDRRGQRVKGHCRQKHYDSPSHLVNIFSFHHTAFPPHPWSETRPHFKVFLKADMMRGCTSSSRHERSSVTACNLSKNREFARVACHSNRGTSVERSVRSGGVWSNHVSSFGIDMQATLKRDMFPVGMVRLMPALCNIGWSQTY